jgi:hypothetical protein
MKHPIFMLLIGIAFGIVVTLPMTVVAGGDAVTKLTGAATVLSGGQQTQGESPQPGQAHQHMHQMMEQCAKHMEGMGGSGMEGMMGMMMNRPVHQMKGMHGQQSGMNIAPPRADISDVKLAKMDENEQLQQAQWQHPKVGESLQ